MARRHGGSITESKRMSSSQYEASQAASVAAGIAVLTAIIFAGGGIAYLRNGESTGWLLVGLAAIALVSAVGVFLRVRRPPGGRS